MNCCKFVCRQCFSKAMSPPKYLCICDVCLSTSFSFSPRSNEAEILKSNDCTSQHRNRWARKKRFFRRFSWISLKIRIYYRAFIVYWQVLVGIAPIGSTDHWDVAAHFSICSALSRVLFAHINERISITFRPLNLPLFMGTVSELPLPLNFLWSSH